MADIRDASRSPSRGDSKSALVCSLLGHVAVMGKSPRSHDAREPNMVRRRGVSYAAKHCLQPHSQLRTVGTRESALCPSPPCHIVQKTSAVQTAVS